MKLMAGIVCAGLVCGGAQAGLMYGENAEMEFAQLQLDLNENYLDFESVSAGTNLNPGTDPFGVGARFASIRSTSGAPMSPGHVEVSNRHRSGEFGNSLVGSPGGSDDARVGYEVAFDEVQRRAGLLRIWNTGSLTQFYNAAGELLAEHQNTASAEFVGWMADSDDESTWVARIVMDTVLTSGRQVGHSDDLYFGTAVPAPGALGLMLIGLGGMVHRRR